MLPNRARGEVSAVIGGREVRLCVTLGALATLEGYFHVSGLEALAERLQRIGPADVPVVVRALAMDEVGEVGVEAMAAVVAAFEAMHE